MLQLHWRNSCLRSPKFWLRSCLCLLPVVLLSYVHGCANPRLRNLWLRFVGMHFGEGWWWWRWCLLRYTVVLEVPILIACLSSPLLSSAAWLARPIPEYWITVAVAGVCGNAYIWMVVWGYSWRSLCLWWVCVIRWYGSWTVWGLILLVLDISSRGSFLFRCRYPKC